MSYDPTSGVDRDTVRLLIGDTSDDVLLERLSDDEIDLILSLETSTGLPLPFYAAATALGAIHTKFLQRGEGVTEKRVGKFVTYEFGFGGAGNEALAARILALRTRGAELSWGATNAGQSFFVTL